ncbi:MAG: phage tail tape measure protein [Butyrivibrio sp.]|nr:phage tail tape measure protein [Butyrivibrio sp.]
MAATRIKGITIEIGGDTTKLTKALSQVDSAINRTQQNLRDINKALKFDPGNTTLLKDKQVELAKQIEATEQRIKEEKIALDQLNEKLDQPFDLDHAEEFQKNAKAAEELKLQIDLDTAALKDLENQARQSASVLGTQMQLAGQKIQEVGQRIKSVGDGMKAFGEQLTATVTVPLVAIGTKAVSSFAEVDKTMTLTNKTMGNTAEEAKALDDAMKAAASNSTFGMADAAQASLNFARAGLDAAQAASAIAPAMNLAAGEAGNLDTVSQGLVGTINAFGDSFEQTEHYADVFAAACNNSALDVDTLSESMSVAAPIFNTAGKSVEDAALMLGVMANANIDANTAANSLKTGMARLAEPTKQAKKAMAEYGIAMSDIWNEDGSMKDMTVVQENLNKAFSQLSEQEQMAAAGAIFGKNQMSAWLAVINTAPADVQALNDSLSGVDGTTRAMSDAMMTGFGGSIEKLKSSIDVLMTTLGSLLADYLTPIIEKIQGLVDKFMSLDAETQKDIVQWGLVAAAIGPVIAIVGTLVGKIGTIITVVGQVTSGLGGLITSMSGVSGATGGLGAALTALSGPIGIVVAAVTAFAAGIAYLYTTSESFRNTVNTLAGTIRDNFGKAMQEIGPKIDELGQRFQSFMTTLQPIFEVILTLVVACVNGIIGAIGPIVDFISGIVEVIMGIIQAFFSLFTGDWEGFWEGIETIIDGAVNIIKGIMDLGASVWNGIISTFGVKLKDNFEGMWEKVKTTVKEKIENIRQNIEEKWNHIKEWIGTTLSSIWDKFKEIFQNIVDSVSEKIADVRASIEEGMENAIEYLASLPSRFFDWGRDMISSLIDGIRDMIGDLADAAAEVADTIAEYIHFSEPDVGPLSNFHTFMPDMIDTMIKGIDQNIPRLQKSMDGMAGSMASSMQGGSTTYAGTTNVNLTVYGAPGQDISALADVIEQRIAMHSIRRGAAGA